MVKPPPAAKSDKPESEPKAQKHRPDAMSEELKPEASDAPHVQEEEGQKPFQFTIRHIIFLTVGVALLCALWNVLNVKFSVYLSSILMSLFALALFYCTYSLPKVLSDTKRKSTIIIGSLMIAYQAFWFSLLLATIMQEFSLWVFSLMFPYTLIAIVALQPGDNNTGFTLCFLTMFAQTFIYVITFMLAKKRKRALIASVCIGILHIFAAPIGYYFIRSL